MCGFSEPSDIESSQSSNEENTVEETSSLDLLSAMLEGTAEDKDVRKKQRPKRTQRKKKITASNGKNCKDKSGVADSHRDELECEGDKTEEMSDMKGMW